MQSTREHNLKLAEKGAWVSIAAYIILSILNITVAQVTRSESLRANGFNNITDILGNIAILIGLRMARVPRDNNHTYGHWKVESLSSLIMSFIMAFVAFEVLQTTVSEIISREQIKVDPIGAVVGLISAIVMVGVYFYNRRLAKQVTSSALMAASKDNLSDAATSIGTSIAIIAASFNLPLIDQLMALLICGFIFKTAFDIFRDSAFSLSDGFNDSLYKDYRTAIESIDKVKSVKMLRGRTYGSNIFLDVVVKMSPDLSVLESHATTEVIEKLLREQFNVYDTDVHVEPSELPDEEKEAALALKLLELEEQLITDPTLMADNFIEINENGVESTTPTRLINGISQYRPHQISPKTFILTYKTGHYSVISVWHRKDEWYCVYRQLTKFGENDD